MHYIEQKVSVNTKVMYSKYIYFMQSLVQIY